MTACVGRMCPDTERASYADTLAKAGKNEEAIAVYNTLIASEKCSASIKEKVKTALEKLGKPAK